MRSQPFARGRRGAEHPLQPSQGHRLCIWSSSEGPSPLQAPGPGVPLGRQWEVTSALCPSGAGGGEGAAAALPSTSLPPSQHPGVGLSSLSPRGSLLELRSQGCTRAFVWAGNIAPLGAPGNLLRRRVKGPCSGVLGIRELSSSLTARHPP